MESVYHPPAALARLYGEPARRVPFDRAGRRPHAPGRYDLVYQPYVAGVLLAAVVRRDHPPHSPARPRPYQGTGRSGRWEVRDLWTRNTISSPAPRALSRCWPTSYAASERAISSRAAAASASPAT